MDTKELEQIYAELERATDAYYNAATTLINVKNNTEIRRLEMVAAGEIVGKNEDERRANTRGFLSAEYIAIESCEKEERAAKLRYDLACQRVEFAKQSIRLMEILK